jgi:dTDP-glucose 4,6-dehydratase
MLKNRKRVIVTGGAGFIGKHFVRLLLDSDQEVINIDKLTYASDKRSYGSFYDFPNYSFIHGDIATLESLPEADFIVNFAAESHVDNSIRSSRHFTQTNLVGVHNLLDLVRMYEPALRPQFVQISTDEIYGDNIDGAFDETALQRPSNPYAASKAAADNMIHAYARTYGIKYQIIRPNNNFGLRQYPEKLIPRSILRLHNGQNAQIHGNGSYRRVWLHVEDAVQAISTIVWKGEVDTIYNISGDEELTIEQVIHKITEAMSLNANERIEFVDNRPGQDVRYMIDDSRVRALGWKPAHKFEESLLEIVTNTIKDPHW